TNKADDNLIEATKIETISADDQKFSSFLTTANHSVITSTKSLKCLSPVVEDSNSSGNSSLLTTDSVSTVASILSSTGNVSASETTTCFITPSDVVTSSIATSSVKVEHSLSSNKSIASTSRSSTTSQQLSNRSITDKRHSVPTRPANSRSNDKSKLVTNNSTKTPRTILHRSPISHATTISGTSSNMITGNIVENMRKVLENRLNTTLPSGRSQLSASLADGVKLCNFANRIRLRAVHSLFTPVSEELPLSPPKCRRNVDSFLAACRRIGVP
uniref:Calponin-homology (CH) domain-containing protein n=1 Tax=Wuchereria bancrofti TaxID=6293 RepID=A0A1I8EGI1_WUCBA